MAKSKYTEETVEKILTTLRLTGSDRHAIASVGINKATFYDWCNRFPDFSNQVAQAKKFFREKCPEQMRERATEALLDYLYGRVEESWTSEEVIREGDKVTVKTSVKKVKRGVPPWAIDRVLGRPIDELEAIKCLIESGWLPFHILNTTTQSLEEIRDRMRAAFANPAPLTVKGEQVESEVSSPSELREEVEETNS